VRRFLLESVNLAPKCARKHQILPDQRDKKGVMQLTEYCTLKEAIFDLSNSLGIELNATISILCRRLRISNWFRR
jgi:hypothetical protein